MKLACITLLLCGFVLSSCADNTNNTAAAIAEHRQKYITLDREYQSNYSTIITNEPRRYALVQAQLREQEALVHLGYLTETNVPFKAAWSEDLSRALWRARLSDLEVATVTAPYTNGGSRVIRIRARPNDVEVWNRIIVEHDTR